MAEKEIVIYGNSVLREVSQPVEKFDRELKNLVSQMSDALKKARGLGLSAVQIGVLQRVFIVDLTVVDINETLRVFVNPEILETSGEAEFEEGCLSFPGIYQKLVRPDRVKVRAYDLDGHVFELEVKGLIARAILHEYDHLEGKLFIDYFSPIAKSLVKGKLRKLKAAS